MITTIILSQVHTYRVTCKIYSDHSPVQTVSIKFEITGLILGLRPANERRRYKVTPSLIGWTQTYNHP